MKAKTIVITRPAKQAEKFAVLLKEKGLIPLYLPLIKTVTHSSLPQNTTLFSLSKYQWIVFTSVNGVDHFIALAGSRLKNKKVFGNVKLATVGPATAKRLEAHDLKADWLPSSYTGACLAQELPLEKGDNILIPRALKGLAELPKILANRGACVKEIPVYDTVSVEHSRNDFMAIIDQEPDVFTFTSPSAVESFKKHLEKFKIKPIKTYYAAIGPTTAKSLKDKGFPVNLMPERYTLEELTRLLAEPNTEQSAG